jgi:hypothetical protein
VTRQILTRVYSGFWEAAWGRGGVSFFFGMWNVEFGWFLELFVLVPYLVPLVGPTLSVGRPCEIRTPEFTWFKIYGLSSLACVQGPIVLCRGKGPFS